jgi:hypothetical protein
VELLIRVPTFRTLRRPRACLALLLLLGFRLAAQSAGEYEVKAAFLYKFASFVELPDALSDGPLCIGVLGQDPFGPALDEVVKGKSYQGRSFEIRRFKPGQESNKCQILFISAAEPKKLSGNTVRPCYLYSEAGRSSGGALPPCQGLRAVLDRLQGAAVLTVGDVPGFCENGGMVNLGLAGSKVQLEINVEAAEKAGLHLNSRLLSLARIVRAAQGGK